MPRLRTFLAVSINDHLRRQLSTLQAELAAAAANAKWVASENLHITLLFLGEVDTRELPAICDLAAQTTLKLAPFRYTLGGLGAFPNLRRPKTIWAGLHEGHERMVDLFHRLEAAFSSAGHYRREDRAYVPHLTLGRIKNEADALALGPMVAQRRGWRGSGGTVAEVQLLASELRRTGPEYSLLARAPLHGDGSAA